MTWLLAGVIAYFIFAVIYLVDKHLLSGPIPNPKVYAFYLGLLAMFVFLAAPFAGFYVPSTRQILLSLFAGAVFIYGVYWFLKTLSMSQAFQATSIVGGMTPLFAFGISYIVTSGEEKLSVRHGLAFLALILGTFLINLEEKKGEATSRKVIPEYLFNWGIMKFSVISAFLFGLYYVLLKYVYMGQTFWNGLMWMRFGGLVVALLFLLSRETRREVFGKRVLPDKKVFPIFIGNQVASAVANLMINWAVALAPFMYVPVVNALQGVQYVFTLVLAVIISRKYPDFLREENDDKNLFYKISGVLLIIIGVFALALKTKVKI